jgi:hypothetical protein
MPRKDTVSQKHLQLSSQVRMIKLFAIYLSLTAYLLSLWFGKPEGHIEHMLSKIFANGGI